MVFVYFLYIGLQCASYYAFTHKNDHIEVLQNQDYNVHYIMRLLIKTITLKYYKTWEKRSDRFQAWDLYKRWQSFVLYILTIALIWRHAIRCVFVLLELNSTEKYDHILLLRSWPLGYYIIVKN